jgi:hypothetical protein
MSDPGVQTSMNAMTQSIDRNAFQGVMGAAVVSGPSARR